MATATLPPRASLLTVGQWRWFGLTCLALVLLFDLICVVLSFYKPEGPDYATITIGLSTFVLFAAIGALILSRVPGHAVGVLFALAPVGMMATNVVAFYVEATELDLPGRGLLAAIFDPLWAIGAFSLAIYLSFLFPTGTYTSPRWRWFGRAAALAFAILFFSWSLRPGPLHDTEGYDNPIGIPGTRGVMELAELMAVIVMLVALFAAVISLILRFIRSRGVEREQLKWFASALLTVIALFALGEPLTAFTDIVLPDAVILLFMALVPVSVGVAILRYRLYDIDLILNRALVYGSLTAFLAGLYAAAIQLFKTVFEAATGETSDATIILTTLLLAAVFTPAKNRLQKLVDRYFGQVHTPKSLDSYTERVTALVQILNPRENAREFLLNAVDSFNLKGGAAYLYEGGQAEQIAEVGEANGDLSVRVPFGQAGGEAGYLLLGPHTDGLQYTKEELEALKAAGQVVGQAVTLTEGLRRAQIGSSL